LFADQQVVVSPWAQRRLEAEGVQAELIEPSVLPLNSSEEGRARCRELYGDYVLFAGDLRPGGGVESALAAAQYFPKGLNLVLACRPKTAADYERKRWIEEQIESLSAPRVFLLGQIDWIGDLVSAARAQLLPATDLTGKMDWPLVILEGFAAGVPAVTAQDSPMADLAEPSLGVAAAKDARGLASEVERVLSLDSEQTRDLYNRRFTPKRLATDYRRVYRSMGLMI
jgi:glycosyltransferase involved in cell wall biosynthesis